MRDAMGGSVALVIIVVFIVIALGYMAFNVNYTKAFRMKNKIISVYEDYDGNCLSDCRSAIKEYSKTIGYSSGNNMNCPAGYRNSDNLYCYKKMENLNVTNNDGVINDTRKRSYYRVITKINVEIPIINNILDLKIFYITGDTKTFEEE
jgi:hypothetical protein